MFRTIALCIIAVKAVFSAYRELEQLMAKDRPNYKAFMRENKKEIAELIKELISGDTYHNVNQIYQKLRYK